MHQKETNPYAPPQDSNMDSCSIEYENSKMDVFFYQLHTISRITFFRVLFGGLFCIFLYAQFDKLDVRGYGFAITAITAFLTAVILSIPAIGLQIIILGMFTLFRNHSGIVGKHTLAIDSKGIRETTAFNENFHKWAGYRSFLSTKNYLIIYIAEGNGHIIPKLRTTTGRNIAEFEAAFKRIINSIEQ